MVVYTLFVFRSHCGSDIPRYHPYFLPPCHQADLHVPTAPTIQKVRVQYSRPWIRSQYQFWLFSKNPVFWSILPKCSSSSWRNVWTTDKALLSPGTHCPSLKGFNNLFLTYKPWPWSSWKTTLSITHWEPESWFLPLLPIPKKRTTSWRMPFNYYIVHAHLLTDLQALSLLNGYGNITLIPCSTSSLNFPKYKLFTASLKPGTLAKINICDTVKKKLRQHPVLLAGCVCVYLLKRSKTCTSCGCWT